MELSLRNEQKQLLSPKMIQSAEILQMTAADLEQYLNEQMLENPVLELKEKQSEPLNNRELETYLWISSHDEQNRYLYQKMESSEDEPTEWNIDIKKKESLQEHLWNQLLTINHFPESEPALKFLLESLDSRGYFTDNFSELKRQFSISEEQASELLSLIQSLEPAGVGARSLNECLCLQLKRQNRLTPELENFICLYLNAMAKNQLPAIAKAMKLPLEIIKEFCEEVKKLDPKPGALFSDTYQCSYIIPDIIVKKTGDNFDIMLNESLYPDISMNSTYVRMCNNQEDDQVKAYLLDKIHHIEWLKQCISQRNVTLLSVAHAILNAQNEFFLHGSLSLRPLRLAEIADVLGIHESTVSRAVHQKYLQCSWGVFPLSYFFAKAAKKSTTNNTSSKTELMASSATDSSITVSDVKKALSKLLESEDKNKPYSDRIIAELLTNQQIPIARRTVTKYRKELGIPGVSGRRIY
jgi:RNA polymerase sigma-54 factor